MNFEPLVEVKNLSIAFPEGNHLNKVVHNVSFNISKGKTLGIVGESGSGKSLSSLCIIRLLSKAAIIESGEILFHQQEKGTIDLLRLEEKKMRALRGSKIAMIFQEPMTSLNPVMKCGEQVAEALRLHMNLSRKEAKKKTIDWFKEVELPRANEMYNAYPHQISGGQKQRVMIAMAMCCKPQLLIADEPTTALDVTVQMKILALIKRLQKKHGMSVIFITHDLGVVANVADELLVMKKGESVEFGDTKTIFNAPRNPYTKGLIACRPPMDYTLSKLPTVDDFLNLNPNIKISDIINDLKVIESKDTLSEKGPLLTVKNLKTYFPIKKGIWRKTVGHVKAVDEVSFDVRKGETLGLVGESGCGKTTLGRSILRLIEPSDGEVVFDGIKVNQLDKERMRRFRKRMQIIFQDPYSSLNPKMRIGDAILEPMKVHGIGNSTKSRKDKVVDLLETVGLEADHVKRYPHQFSGGQRQRICIARTLALSPEFVICDESVSALDVSVQAQVLNLLNELKSKFDFTYIFISHDLSVVKYMSDRLIVMRAGKVEEMGSSEELYRNPKSEYTQSLIEAIPKIA